MQQQPMKCEKQRTRITTLNMKKKDKLRKISTERPQGKKKKKEGFVLTFSPPDN